MAYKRTHGETGGKLRLGGDLSGDAPQPVRMILVVIDSTLWVDFLAHRRSVSS